jgi:aminopeptidase N
MMENLPNHYFQSEKIEWELTDDHRGRLTIQGKKTGRPSHRLVLPANDLKFKSAQITHHRKDQSEEKEIARINHLPTRGDVRLHTKHILYPGTYKINVEFESKSKINPEKLKSSFGIL